MTDYALELSEAEVARYRAMAERAFESERDLWTAAGIVEGASVADVGCGPGATSLVLAEVVGPSGTVCGVDRDGGAMAAAQAAAHAAGARNVRFQKGDADYTGLDPAAFDVVMLRHVLAHNGGREQAIVDHLAGLVRPGGCVYLVDVEATAVRFHPEQPDLRDLAERYAAFQNSRGNDMSIGLRLAELLEAAALEVVAFRGRYDVIPSQPGLRGPPWAARQAMVEAGVAEPADVDRWAAAFEGVDRGMRRFTTFLPVFVAVGCRPDAAA